MVRRTMCELFMAGDNRDLVVLLCTIPTPGRRKMVKFNLSWFDSKLEHAWDGAKKVGKIMTERSLVADFPTSKGESGASPISNRKTSPSMKV